MNTKKMSIIAGLTEKPMVCPRCGKLIPEGKLYCESCGQEISFVPDFEPEVDDSIASALNGLASEIALANAESAGLSDSSGGFVRREDTDGDHIDIHIRLSKRGLRAAAAALCVAAVVVAAVIAIPRIVTLRVFDRQSRAMTEINEGEEESAPVNEEINARPDETGGGVISDIVAPPKPEIEPGSGRYDSGLTVAIENADPELDYYYTTDGAAPEDNGLKYTGPFVIDGEGDVTVRAVAVSQDGVYSEEGVAVYFINSSGPAAPVILEDSGDYTQSTMIVAVMQEDCRITYTTDGSEPDEDSAEYTSPIVMPVGNSVFKFRAFDSEGAGSETVERVYHLVYARLVSEEQAIASVVRILVDKNVLLDESGKVLGQDGYNAYRVDSVIEIEGAGEYYRIVESYGTAAGEQTDTGLLYAVNTNDGSVHRLGYDSSGKYTLFTLSGR